MLPTGYTRCQLTHLFTLVHYIAAEHTWGKKALIAIFHIYVLTVSARHLCHHHRHVLMAGEDFSVVPLWSFFHMLNVKAFEVAQASGLCNMEQTDNKNIPIKEQSVTCAES